MPVRMTMEERRARLIRLMERFIPGARRGLSRAAHAGSMSDLATAVCSITSTQRGRFFWAAWWTGTPSFAPFRKPDASNGGAATREEALAEAERVAGRHLVAIEAYWAHAWNRMLRGEPPPPPPSRKPPRPPRPASTVPRSAWAVLGLAPGATPDEVKSAYRKRALETHPDRGGDADAFREVQRAYEKLLRARRR